jgi:hypothetical protein
MVTRMGEERTSVGAVLVVVPSATSLASASISLLKVLELRMGVVLLFPPSVTCSMSMGREDLSRNGPSGKERRTEYFMGGPMV